MITINALLLFHAFLIGVLWYLGGFLSEILGFIILGDVAVGMMLGDPLAIKRVRWFGPFAILWYIWLWIEYKYYEMVDKKKDI
jgi:hypothetical protein